MTPGHAPLRGLLVTVDGPGGAGKSTVVPLVVERLTHLGIDIVATTEPSRTELGDLVRGGTERFSGLTLACLVAADRYHHLEKEVRPALDRGAIVVCDRYLATSLVLQRMDGVDETIIWDLAHHVDLPDVAVILSAETDVLAARVADRGAHSRWERDPRNAAVEAALYKLAANSLRSRGVYVVPMDSTATPPQAIADEIASLVKSAVGRQPARS